MNEFYYIARLRIKRKDDKGNEYFGRGVADLLHGVDEFCSLNLAARHMGMAYSKAWRIVRQAEEALGIQLLHRMRKSGSIPRFIEEYGIDNGIMYSCVKNKVPFVLTGSIRDDGPLPEVIGDVYQGQTAMRNMVKKATTVICLATMLHTIATGNMTPSYRVMEDGTVRPVFLYTVDADEFVVNKLLDRGSLSATTIVTNVQDFIMIVAKGLGLM